MLRQAKEAEMPFLQDNNDGNSSGNSFKSDHEEEEKKVEKNSENSDEEVKNPERLAADGNVSSRSSELEISGSDTSDELLDSKEDINHPKGDIRKQSTLYRRATIFAGNFNPENGEELPPSGGYTKTR